eukprot:2785167-Alexandrium_andersonii.AAC.1
MVDSGSHPYCIVHVGDGIAHGVIANEWQHCHCGTIGDVGRAVLTACRSLFSVQTCLEKPHCGFSWSRVAKSLA